MTTITLVKKIAAVGSIAALFTSSMTSAFASDIRIDGNGYRSENTVRVSEDNSTSISQSNTTDITNDVSVVGNTRGNSVSGTTGGDVSLRTGDTNSDVRINNAAGLNQLSLSGDCGCQNHNTSVEIRGNGTDSNNDVTLNTSHDQTYTQNNNIALDNRVNVVGNTGGNELTGNTNSSGDNWMKNSGNNEWMNKWMNDNWGNNNFSSSNQSFINWQNFLDRLRHSNYSSSNGENGSVNIQTGDANSNVEINNQASANMLGM